MSLTVSALPVLEPLSDATETLLEPLTLYQNDFLRIALTDDIKHFIVTPESWRRYDHPVEGCEYRDGAYWKQDWVPSRNAQFGWQDRIPEKQKDLGGGKYQISATDFSALVIRHAWPEDRLIFDSPEARTVFTALLIRFLGQREASQIIADFKVAGKLPEMPEDYIRHPDPNLVLADYQEAALLFSLNRDCGLFMEQGTGKTPIVVNRICLEGFRKRRDKGQLYRALIVCPKHVRKNWENEFVRFSTRIGKVVSARGGELDRLKAVVEAVTDDDPECCFSACIISVDSVKATKKALQTAVWDLIVWDESHYGKNPTAKRSKAMREFNDTLSVHKMALTGTPIANHLMDLWSQLEFLGEGMSGFLAFKNFRGFHGKYKSVGTASPVQKLIGIKALPVIQERLARLAFLCKQDEVGIKLPDLVYDIYEVDMLPTQAEVYKNLSETLVAEIKAGLESEKITVNHVLTMLLRLAQVTSGHVRLDGEIDPETAKATGGEIRQICAENPKVDAIVDIIREDRENNPGSKTVIWATFVEDIRVLSERLAREGIKHVGYHDAVVKEFKVGGADLASDRFNLDPECSVMLANPASAGEGLNLLGYDKSDPDRFDTYCNHEIFFSCNWSMVQRSQAEKRCHRRGTRGPVRVTDLIVSETIDEEIRARVLSKKQSANLIQDISEILSKLVSQMEKL